MFNVIAGLRLDRDQRRLLVLVGEELYGTPQLLSLRRDDANLALFYCYYHGLCSEELHSIAPLLKTFGRTTRSSSSIQMNHPHFILVPRVNRNFHGDSFSQSCCSVEQSTSGMLPRKV